MNGLVGSIFALTAHYMRLWDYASSARVDYFVANSKFVSSRIRKYYRRDSSVIYPPVDTSYGNTATPPGDYYTTIGRLVDYKRFDLAVHACTTLGRRLTVIGDGPEYKHLRRIAGPTIQFLGAVSDAELRANLSGARAFLFPGEEDFGIAAVEAQSFGRPVIAFGAGGALETVRGDFAGASRIDSPTGVFFDEQSSDKLAEAILRFESEVNRFSPETIRKQVLQFDTSVFKGRMEEFLCWALEDFKDPAH
jgi:glycosyltransferase involved in cell wall biosynthesis